MEIKEYDVFKFRYNKENLQKRFEPYHCFDGQLIAFKQSDDQIRLMDTFWMNRFKPDGDCRTFDLEEAQEKGELEFKCNLNEIEYITESQAKYYKDEDIINLAHHHRYKKVFAVPQGTKQDVDAAIEALEKKLKDKKQVRECLDSEIEDLNIKLGEAKQGKLPISI